jgi:hypothetical protein
MVHVRTCTHVEAVGAGGRIVGGLTMISLSHRTSKNLAHLKSKSPPGSQSVFFFNKLLKMISFHSIILVLIISLLVTTQSAAFLGTRALSDASRSCSSDNFSCPTFLSALVPSTESDVTKNNDALSWDVHMIDDIIDLCEQGKVLDATKLLTEPENSEKLSTERDYVKIFKALTRISNSQSAKMADGLIDHMTENSENVNGCRPTAESYNAAISVWASSNRRDSATRCCEYLNTLWSLYDETSDTKYVPLRSSYIHTIDALARSRQGYQGAKQAESLLDDMEVLRHEHPSLSPNTLCFNAVLNAWSKSGVLKGAAEMSEELLNRMISLCNETGLNELMPDTTSFNTVMHTLAKSKEKNRESRAEALLELMNQLSSEDNDLGAKCKPDQVVSQDGLCGHSTSLKVIFVSQNISSVVQHSFGLLGVEPVTRQCSSCNFYFAAHGTEICCKEI